MTDQPERLHLESLDVAEDRIALLQEDFPEVFRDGKIDFDALKRTLGEWVEPENERFGLQWPGKAEAFQAVQTPSVATLLPDPVGSVDWDTTQNLIIEGDNLEVLKLLQKSYYGKVKMIYIDPPYNTGNDFIYPDNYREGLQSYLEFTGQVNGEGKKLSTNTETAGRYHSNWLNMMYPRLFLSRNLLRDDGVIFVSIDDNEVHNLREILDQVFGEDNFLNTFVWVSNLKGRQISGSGAAGTKEYVLSYARSASLVGDFKGRASVLKTLMPTVYKGLDYEVKMDQHGPYVIKNELYNTNSAFNEVTRPTLVFDIYYDPTNGDVKTSPVSTEHKYLGYSKIAPKRNNNGVNKFHAFRWSTKKVESEPHNLEFVQSPHGYRVFTKVRETDVTTLKDLFMDISTTSGANDVEAVGLDSSVLDYPKPVNIIKTVTAATTVDSDIILDMFAGSGTTGHAVMKLNAEDGGNRRYILVQLPEPVDPPKVLGDGTELATIADITRERVRRAGRHITGGVEPQPASPGESSREDTRSSPKGNDHKLDVGFRSYKLASSNFTPWDGTPLTDASAQQIAMRLESFTDNVLPGRDHDDILAEIILKLGYELTAPVERLTLAGHEVFSLDEGAVLVCLDSSLSLDLFEAMVERNPGQIVCLDAGFQNDDELKVNASQVIRSRARSEESTIRFWVV